MGRINIPSPDEIAKKLYDAPFSKLTSGQKVDVLKFKKILQNDAYIGRDNYQIIQQAVAATIEKEKHVRLSNLTLEQVEGAIMDVDRIIDIHNNPNKAEIPIIKVALHNLGYDAKSIQCHQTITEASEILDEIVKISKRRKGVQRNYGSGLRFRKQKMRQPATVKSVYKTGNKRGTITSALVSRAKDIRTSDMYEQTTGTSEYAGVDGDTWDSAATLDVKGIQAKWDEVSELLYEIQERKWKKITSKPPVQKSSNPKFTAVKHDVADLIPMIAPGKPGTIEKTSGKATPMDMIGTLMGADLGIHVKSAPSSIDVHGRPSKAYESPLFKSTHIEPLAYSSTDAQGKSKLTQYYLDEMEEWYIRYENQLDDYTDKYGRFGAKLHEAHVPLSLKDVPLFNEKTGLGIKVEAKIAHAKAIMELERAVADRRMGAASDQVKFLIDNYGSEFSRDTRDVTDDTNEIKPFRLWSKTGKYTDLIEGALENEYGRGLIKSVQKFYNRFYNTEDSVFGGTIDHAITNIAARIVEGELKLKDTERVGVIGSESWDDSAFMNKYMRKHWNPNDIMVTSLGNIGKAAIPNEEGERPSIGAAYQAANWGYWNDAFQHKFKANKQFKRGVDGKVFHDEKGEPKEIDLAFSDVASVSDRIVAFFDETYLTTSSFARLQELRDVAESTKKPIKLVWHPTKQQFDPDEGLKNKLTFMEYFNRHLSGMDNISLDAYKPPAWTRTTAMAMSQLDKLKFLDFSNKSAITRLIQDKSIDDEWRNDILHDMKIEDIREFLNQDPEKRDTPASQKIRALYAKSIMGKDVEHMGIFQPGQLRGQFSVGEEGEAFLTQLQRADLPASVGIHNHPSGEPSFSFADIRTALLGGMYKQIAISGSGDFTSLKITPDLRENADDFLTRLDLIGYRSASPRMIPEVMYSALEMMGLSRDLYNRGNINNPDDIRFLAKGTLGQTGVRIAPTVKSDAPVIVGEDGPELLVAGPGGFDVVSNKNLRMLEKGTFTPAKGVINVTNEPQEDDHFYKTKEGHVLPSVSSIIRFGDKDAQSGFEKAKPYMHPWHSATGTEIHRRVALELAKKQGMSKDTIDRFSEETDWRNTAVDVNPKATGGKLESDLKDMIELGTRSLLNALEGLGFEAHSLEERFVDLDRGFSGTLDLLGTIQGTPTLIDLKTKGESGYKKVDPAHRLQLGAYASFFKDVPDLAQILSVSRTTGRVGTPTMMDSNGIQSAIADFNTRAMSFYDRLHKGELNSQPDLSPLLPPWNVDAIVERARQPPTALGRSKLVGNTQYPPMTLDGLSNQEYLKGVEINAQYIENVVKQNNGMLIGSSRFFGEQINNLVDMVKSGELGESDDLKSLFGWVKSNYKTISEFGSFGSPKIKETADPSAIAYIKRYKGLPPATPASVKPPALPLTPDEIWDKFGQQISGTAPTGGDPKLPPYPNYREGREHLTPEEDFALSKILMPEFPGQGSPDVRSAASEALQNGRSDGVHIEGGKPVVNLCDATLSRFDAWFSNLAASIGSGGSGSGGAPRRGRSSGGMPSGGGGVDWEKVFKDQFLYNPPHPKGWQNAIEKGPIAGLPAKKYRLMGDYKQRVDKVQADEMDWENLAPKGYWTLLEKEDHARQQYYRSIRGATTSLLIANHVMRIFGQTSKTYAQMHDSIGKGIGYIGDMFLMPLVPLIKPVVGGLVTIGNIIRGFPVILGIGAVALAKIGYDTYKWFKLIGGLPVVIDKTCIAIDKFANSVLGILEKLYPMPDEIKNLKLNTDPGYAVVPYGETGLTTGPDWRPGTHPGWIPGGPGTAGHGMKTAKDIVISAARTIVNAPNFTFGNAGWVPPGAGDPPIFARRGRMRRSDRMLRGDALGTPDWYGTEHGLHTEPFGDTKIVGEYKPPNWIPGGMLGKARPEMPRPSPKGELDGIPYYANGGVIPGFGNKDSELIAAMPGEVILSHKMLKQIGIKGYADGGIVGGATGLIGGLTSAYSGVVSSEAGSAALATLGAVSKTAGALMAPLAPALAAGALAGKGFSMVTNAITRANAGVSAIMSGGFGALRTMAAAQLVGIVGGLGPLVPIGAAILGIYAWTQGFGPIAEGTLRGIGEGIRGAFDWLKERFKTPDAPKTADVKGDKGEKSIWDRLAEKAAELYQRMLEKLKPVFDVFDRFKLHMQNAVDFVKGIAERLKPVYEVTGKIFEGIKGVFDSIKGVFKGLIKSFPILEGVPGMTALGGVLGAFESDDPVEIAKSAALGGAGQVGFNLIEKYFGPTVSKALGGFVAPEFGKHIGEAVVSGEGTLSPSNLPYVGGMIKNNDMLETGIRVGTSTAISYGMGGPKGLAMAALSDLIGGTGGIWSLITGNGPQGVIGESIKSSEIVNRPIEGKYGLFGESYKGTYNALQDFEIKKLTVPTTEIDQKATLAELKSINEKLKQPTINQNTFEIKGDSDYDLFQKFSMWMAQLGNQSGAQRTG
jgi:hypothetical protein